MTEADLALAREAVACKHWEWMPGMLDINGRRIIRVDGDKLTVAWYGNPHHRLAPDITVVSATDFPPDLDDPATVGCLEALVQRVLGHDGVNVIVEPRWGVGVGYRVTRWTRSAIDSCQPMTIGGMGHATKAAALVAALKAAP